MTSPRQPYLRWVDEEIEGPAGSRLVRVAWLAQDDPLGGGTRFLAYLGDRPLVTPHLIEEVESLYPDLAVDWDALRQELERQTGRTSVAALTDDEVAQRLRGWPRNDLSLTDLSLRLGYRQRNVLAELLRFLDDPVTVARLERTSSGIFAYFDAHHPEYAFLLYKARLLFEDDAEGLRLAIRLEPTGFGSAGARRAFWREQLDSYRARRRAPRDSED